MPIKDPNAAEKYYRQYQEDLRSGKRRKEPATLEDALAELRALRRLVQAQRKRIWYLENKDEQTEAQRRRRRAVSEQNAQAALAWLQKITGTKS